MADFIMIIVSAMFINNFVVVQFLGICPFLGVSKDFKSALGMGLAALVVLLCSNIFISLLRKIIPETMRIPCYIVIIAGFVTIVKMLIQAFFPALYETLGVYLDLITVNCIILGRAESFASKNGLGRSALDGIFQGIGYTIVLIIMCVVREFLGAGKFGGGLLGGGGLGAAPGIVIFPEEYGLAVLTLPVGGFLTLGVLIAAMQWGLAKAKKKEAK